MLFASLVLPCWSTVEKMSSILSVMLPTSNENSRALIAPVKACCTGDSFLQLSQIFLFTIPPTAPLSVGSSRGSRKPSRHLHHSLLASRFSKNPVANHNGGIATAETLRVQNRSLDHVGDAFVGTADVIYDGAAAGTWCWLCSCCSLLLPFQILLYLSPVLFSSCATASRREAIDKTLLNNTRSTNILQ